MNSKSVYLDYAASTPVDPKVLNKMKPFFDKQFYNAQSLYNNSVKVKVALDDARTSVARICGVKKNEVIFTSSGTESNNLAILGAIKAFYGAEKTYKKRNPKIKPIIITTRVEHPSVLETIKFLESSGTAEIIYLKINGEGQINIEEFQKVLDERVILVSIMLAGNEIGTIYPIKRISAEIKRFKNKCNRLNSDYPFLHTDGSQAPCLLNINLNSHGADLMTLDGSKIYGPKRVGVLIKKSYVPLENILFGGNQEFGLRPGTENMPLIIGFAEALKLAANKREVESVRIQKLRDYFAHQVLKKFPGVYLNGSLDNRLPNNINICAPNLNAEFAVIKLSLLGVECSSVTACKNISDETRSYVVDALGKNCGASSLRFTLGRFTKKSDIDFTLKKLEKVLT